MVFYRIDKVLATMPLYATTMPVQRFYWLGWHFIRVNDVSVTQTIIKNPGNPAMEKSGVFAVCLSRLPPGIADRYMIGGQDLNLVCACIAPFPVIRWSLLTACFLCYGRCLKAASLEWCALSQMTCSHHAAANILPVTLSGSPSQGEPCGLRRCAIFCKSVARLPAAL